MNVSEYMKKHDLTDDALDAVAAPYEDGDCSSEGGTVYTGSHLDAVGKRRECFGRAADNVNEPVHAKLKEA